MKYLCRQRIWSNEHQAYFEPGEVVELGEGPDFEALVENEVLSTDIPEALELVEATPQEEPQSAGDEPESVTEEETTDA